MERDVEGSDTTAAPLESNSRTADVCSVCLLGQKNAHVTDCKHTFCRACIEKYSLSRKESETFPCPLCRNCISVYSIRDIITGKPLKKRSANSPWDPPLTFSQYHFSIDLGEGVASYHFHGTKSSYISYANAPITWKLDDGSKPPPEKRFVNVVYDEKKRILCASVMWDPVTWNGAKEWKYVFKFDEGFNNIIDGHVKSFSASDEQIEKPQYFNRDLFYRRKREHIFGSVFVQVGAQGVASYHFDAPEESFICYAGAPECWKLDNGKAPPYKKYFEDVSYDHEARIFRGTISWAETPFSGFIRWQYEMLFNPEFTSICGGTCTMYQKDPDKSPTVHRFGVSLFYSILGH
eukprot:CAMPEP_0204830192 /NCGR_PEP_ID=MMETSP1346-20131115/8385_1 /ASSEMBLY_ACC=CAM_ASM_000771 /TAXON_ID=215587 /ORGANISM="Aplanochytrium stocchinoi, Strain GSBS06" /LENGTH=348 /DNA_ID=CAMNT_0051960341 /DNA_START=764 /DNA_END=1810 /DNA_ORIENTATION=-